MDPEEAEENTPSGHHATGRLAAGTRGLRWVMTCSIPFANGGLVSCLHAVGTPDVIVQCPEGLADQIKRGVAELQIPGL